MQRRSEQSPSNTSVKISEKNLEESSSPTDTAGRSGSGRPYEWKNRLECLTTKITPPGDLGTKDTGPSQP